jgi:membrane protease YdiL (CAAX protease family)
MTHNTTIIKEPTLSADPPAAALPIKWGPVYAIFVTFFLYFLTQFAAAFIMFGYALATGMNQKQATDWLENSTPAQFATIFLIEAFTIGGLWPFLRVKQATYKTIGLIRPRLADIPRALAGYFVYFVSFGAVEVLITHFVPSINADQKQQLGFQNSAGLANMAMIFISLVILPPLAEEILVRGFLFGGMRRRLRFVPAALATSALFGVAHLQFGSGAPLLWIAAIDTFMLSLVLTYLREKSGSLWPGILVHFTKNGLAFIALFVYATS